MAALTLLSYRLAPGWWTGFLQASAKAGFVGGIADWFAVTALFRHPLGIPIPHTAIIPNQRARLGQALGRFVANHVITGKEVASVLRQLDLPGILRGFLTDPASARPAAEALSSLLPKLLGTVEDGRAKRVVARVLPAHRRRPGRWRCGRPGAARDGGRRPPPGGVRLHPGSSEEGAGQPGGITARGHRGAGARTGRPPGRLGASAPPSRAAC